MSDGLTDNARRLAKTSRARLGYNPPPVENVVKPPPPPLPPKTSRDWPMHELGNYRVALDKFQRSNLASDWEKVQGNALRLAEAIDLIDRKGKR